MILDKLNMRNSDHRILFQNAEGNINAGICLFDPDMDFDDYIWYDCLAHQMLNSLLNNEGLIYVNDNFKTQSCYVELHRYDQLCLFYL